jgi:hypothetical protein
MRYLVPVFLFLIFISSLLLATSSTFYVVLFMAQVACYLLALGGYFLERVGFRTKLLALPHYFLLANLAAAVAFFKFLRGERYARWEPIRDVGQMTEAAATSSKID